jgi:hypothetical protein
MEGRMFTLTRNSFVRRIATITLVVALLFAVLVNTAFAAAAELSAWVNIYTGSPNNNNGTIAAGNLTVPAGSNRIFIVAVCAELSAPNTSTFGATLGGTALTEIATTGDGNDQEHCWMGYLLNAQIPAAASALSVTYNVGGNGDQVTGIHVRWATYSGIDQTAPIYDSNANYIGAANVTFGANIDYVLGGLTFYAAGNGGSPAAMTLPAGFTQRLITTTNNHSSFVASITTAPHAAGGTYAAATNVAFTGTTSNRSAIVVVSLNPLVPTTTVNDGNNPTNKTVGPSATNQAVSAFTLSTNTGTDTVTNLVVTAGGTGAANLAANVAGVNIYQSANNEWDAGDTLVGTASFVGGTATFPGLNLSVTTIPTNYIITYNIGAAPVNGQTLTAAITGATALNYPVANYDSVDATLTIDTVAPTVTNVSSPDGAQTYGIGDVLTIRVYFSEDVTVTGMPQLTLETGATDRVATFDYVANGDTLYFTYIVQAGDVSADLDYVSANSLTLNGGTIRDAAGNNATLTLFAPGTGVVGAGSLAVNEGLIIDGIAPTVTINQAVGQADPASTQPINFTVVFSEPINGFNGNDIVLTGSVSGNLGGANRNITNLGGNTYNVAVSGLTVVETVTATINANAVDDDGNNGNLASTSTDNQITLLGFTTAAPGRLLPAAPLTWWAARASPLQVCLP